MEVVLRLSLGCDNTRTIFLKYFSLNTTIFLQYLSKMFFFATFCTNLCLLICDYLPNLGSALPQLGMNTLCGGCMLIDICARIPRRVFLLMFSQMIQNTNRVDIFSKKKLVITRIDLNFAS